MRKIIKWVLLGGLVLFLSLVGYFLVRWESPDNWIMGFDPWKEWAYKKIAIEMTKAEVIDLMGQPVEQSNEFYLGQYNGFEKEYERAKRSNSKYYFFWRNGIDIIYAVGFDSEDKVVLKEAGGT